MPLYSVTFRQRAIKEYVESTAWYKEHSFQAVHNFLKVINATINSISTNPYTFRNSYKKFYEAKTKSILSALFILLTRTNSALLLLQYFITKEIL